MINISISLDNLKSPSNSFTIELPFGEAHLTPIGKKRFFTSDNYIMVKKQGRYSFEHRKIAEEVLGRWLELGEEVHHIDGIKINNRKSNLLICTKEYHEELHQRCYSLYGRWHFTDQTKRPEHIDQKLWRWYQKRETKRKKDNWVSYSII